MDFLANAHFLTDQRVLGWSALSGVAVIIFAYLINYPLATYNVYV